MKIFWTLMLISVLMLAFTLPALACDQCSREGPVMSSLVDLDDVQVMVTNMTSELLLDFATPTPMDMPALASAILDPTESVDQRARHVSNQTNMSLLEFKAYTRQVIKENRIAFENERGGVLLRQGGKPAVI